MLSRFEVIEEDCVGCGLCSERAPENFEVPAGTSMAQVFKQPETAAEEQACLEACDYCPAGGLRAGAVDTDASPGGALATLILAGDPTLVDFAPTGLEN
jgi:ferredoxin